MDLVSSFSCLGLRPLSFLTSAERETWGNGDLECLMKQDGEEKRNRSGGKADKLVEPEACREEWARLKEVVLSQK